MSSLAKVSVGRTIGCSAGFTASDGFAAAIRVSTGCGCTCGPVFQASSVVAGGVTDAMVVGASDWGAGLGVAETTTGAAAMAAGVETTGAGTAATVLDAGCFVAVSGAVTGSRRSGVAAGADF